MTYLEIHSLHLPQKRKDRENIRWAGQWHPTLALILKYDFKFKSSVSFKLGFRSLFNFPPPPLTLSTSCSVSSDFLFRFSIRAARSRVSFLAALAFWNPAAAPTPGSTFFPP